MLILTRRLSESIIIGDAGEIEVKVLAIKGGQVRLGITASIGIPVHREEVWERIKKESYVNDPDGNQ